MEGSEPDSRQGPDEALLREFLAGDEGAFAALIRRHSRELFTFVARFIRNPAAAEDVVQDTFVQVYQSAGGFDLSRRFRPWLYTIAANKARDNLRERTRRREVPVGGTADIEEGGQVSYLDFLADDSVAPGEALERGEQREIVRGVIASMPPHLREILILGYYQRFPYKEIAEILSIPLGTVKSRLHAAVAAFAEAYKKAERDRQERSVKR
ncbi:MAG TPA: sigma-70 family RNA polymerase sigma factor [Phycisphaerae bacterium]|nr:sigma-70 family RNA polymerase sigma factor [Phycisphaerae bacterium]